MDSDCADMVETLRNFEEISAGFSPGVLVPAGIAIMLAGLCCWMGGLRWKIVISGLIGICAALPAIYYFTKADILIVVVGTIAVGVMAALCNRITLPLTGAIIATVVILLLTANQSDINQDKSIGEYKPKSYSGTQMDPAETLDTIKTELISFARTVSQRLKQANTGQLAVSAATGAVVLIAGFFIPRLISAAATSAIGTALIFIGLTLLLLYKKAEPLSYVHSNKGVFYIIVPAMLVFGTAAGILLCAKKRPQIIKKTDNGGQ